MERTIPNSLNETWPQEHVYFDFNPADVKGPMTCTIQGITRPTQEERVRDGDRDLLRLWTAATIEWKDDAGNPVNKTPESSIKNIKAVFRPGTAPSPLSIKDEGDYYLIKNGTYEFKVRHYKGDFDKMVRIKHAGETDEVSIDSTVGVKVKTAAGEQVIFAADKLPALGQIKADAASIYRGD